MTSTEDITSSDHEPLGPTRDKTERAVEKAGKRLAVARDEEAKAFEQVQVAILAAIKAGAPEQGMAKLGNVDRMTVRKWLGKRETPKPKR